MVTTERQPAEPSASPLVEQWTELTFAIWEIHWNVGNVGKKLSIAEQVEKSKQKPIFSSRDACYPAGQYHISNMRLPWCVCVGNQFFWSKRHQTANSKDDDYSPCVTALHLALQPSAVLSTSVSKNISMTLLALLILVGREEPQALPNKAVPSPSVILSLSLQFAVLNAVNCKSITIPSSTCIATVFLRLAG